MFYSNNALSPFLGIWWTLGHSNGALAQLVARRSHNPKVVSSILTGPILFFLSFTALKFWGTKTFMHKLFKKQKHMPEVLDKSTELRWSSGYDARLTRERSPVQSWDGVLFLVCYWLKIVSMGNNFLQEGRVAQWIRRRSSEPKIVGSSPTVVMPFFQLRGTRGKTCQLWGSNPRALTCSGS